MGLLERLDATQPPAAEETIKRENSHQRLLSWLTNNWPRSTITLRQLRLHGPYPIRQSLNERKKEEALDLMRGLVERGWIVAIKPERHDTWKWRIGRS
jgi:hypothetical protein